MPRGVISYYAAATLPAATTLRSWQQLIARMSQEDVDRGALGRFDQPKLQIRGGGSLSLIGSPRAEEGGAAS